MGKQNFEVDLVYLWVDGSDMEWQQKKQAYSDTPVDNTEINCAGRYISNDELKYSLRSVEKHAPWIRKIFIVTDNQQPSWLNTANPKIQVVDHKEIFPPECLPNFNSSVIEYYLYKIPGLAEHFLLANDDMFFNADLKPEYFFAEDGYPIIHLKRKIFGKWHYRINYFTGKKLGQYYQMIVDAAALADKKFGKYYTGVPHHNIDAYKKSDYRMAVEEVFKNEAEKSRMNRIRTYGDLHRSAFSYYALAIGHGHLKYVGRKQSSRILVHRHDFRKYIERYHPLLFCLNDSQRVTDEHRKKVKPFLEEMFPEKSSFEK
jgi:hypothetical protein